MEGTEVKESGGLELIAGVGRGITPVE